MKTYELALVLHPDLEIDLKPTLKKVEDQITSLKGEVKSQENWGKQKLSYPINKQDYGIYVFYTIGLEPEQTGALEQNLRLEDAVMRHLLVNMDEKALAVLAERAKGGDPERKRSADAAPSGTKDEPVSTGAADKGKV